MRKRANQLDIPTGSPDFAGPPEHEAMNMPGLVRQDSLSPHSHNMSADAPPLSPAGQKRNKLGYHRTAVACGQTPCSCLPNLLVNNIQAIAAGEKFAAFLPLKIRVADARIVYG